MGKPGVLFLAVIVILAAGPRAAISCPDSTCGGELSLACRSMPNCPMSARSHNRVEMCCTARAFIAWNSTGSALALERVVSTTRLPASAMLLPHLIAVSSGGWHQTAPVDSAQQSALPLFVRLHILLL
jgi:hypothetical protein